MVLDATDKGSSEVVQGRDMEGCCLDGSLGINSGFKGKKPMVDLREEDADSEFSQILYYGQE